VQVVAVGSVSQTFGIADVAKHCFFLKDTSDARLIRQRIIECFEHAEQPNVPPAEKSALLHFVIVGGGPVGVEFAAELWDFVSQDLNRLYPALKPHVCVTMIEAGPTLLGSFDKGLQSYALARYKRAGVAVRTGVAVKGVEHRRFLLSDGSQLRFGLAVWSTGLAPNPLVVGLDAPKDRVGRLLVDDHLLVRGLQDVYALGDCAQIEGAGLPALAQVAAQQGKWLAKHFNAEASNKPLPGPFKFIYRGMLTYVGHYQALVDMPQTKGSGLWAWALWRSYYLTTAISWKNKMIIPMQWLLTWLFGRDVSRF